MFASIIGTVSSSRRCLFAEGFILRMEGFVSIAKTSSDDSHLRNLSEQFPREVSDCCKKSASLIGYRMPTSLITSSYMAWSCARLRGHGHGERERVQSYPVHQSVSQILSILFLTSQSVNPIRSSKPILKSVIFILFPFFVPFFHLMDLTRFFFFIFGKGNFRPSSETPNWTFLCSKKVVICDAYEQLSLSVSSSHRSLRIGLKDNWRRSGDPSIFRAKSITVWLRVIVTFKMGSKTSKSAKEEPPTQRPIKSKLQLTDLYD